MSVPTTDAGLAQYSTNFQERGTAAPGDFGLLAAQMTQYTTLHDSWMDAYNACKAPGARSKALTQAKNDQKALLLPYARELYALVKFSPTTSSANKTLIGIHINDSEPSPEPPPSLPPATTIVSVVGKRARAKIVDSSTPNAKRRPINAKGATVLSYVGATPPAANDPGWKLEGQTGRTIFEVQFPMDVDPTSNCWIIALWYNARGQYSPACQPVQVYLQAGPVAQAA